jgi:ribonuclease HIII
MESRMTTRHYTRWTVGIDEIGRGPLAGPVITVAVKWSQG